MLWTRPSLLMKFTLWPTVTVTDDGVTRPFARVMVAPIGPGLPVPVPAPPADGWVGELPPHAARATSAVAANTFPIKSLLTRITKTSSNAASKKLARQVETQIPIVIAAARRQLPERGAEA